MRRSKKKHGKWIGGGGSCHPKWATFIFQIQFGFSLTSFVLKFSFFQTVCTFCKCERVCVCCLSNFVQLFVFYSFTLFLSFSHAHTHIPEFTLVPNHPRIIFASSTFDEYFPTIKFHPMHFLMTFRRTILLTQKIWRIQHENWRENWRDTNFIEKKANEQFY